MVRITKVYTKTGDGGSTRLAGGQEVSKDSARIEAYGCVDELNACLGLVAEALKSAGIEKELLLNLYRVQNELFNLGSQLAVLPADRRRDTPLVSEDHIRRLEMEIDQMNETLPALTSFILPGGGELGARLHHARTVCRRTERRVIRLSQTEPLDGPEIPYLNRLSDWLFVAARYVAHRQGIDEILWSPAK